MALQSGIPLSFEAYFPRGAFMVGEIEPVVKWSDDGQRQGQDLDKVSGHPLWQVRVIDADPEARKGQNEVAVKIASIAEPTAPPEANGLSFRPVLWSSLSQRTPCRGTAEATNFSSHVCQWSTHATALTTPHLSTYGHAKSPTAGGNPTSFT